MIVSDPCIYPDRKSVAPFRQLLVPLPFIPTLSQFYVIWPNLTSHFRIIKKSNCRAAVKRKKIHIGDDLAVNFDRLLADKPSRLAFGLGKIFFSCT